MVYVLAASSGVSYGVLMLLLGYESICSLQLRWLVGGAWTGSYKHECQPTNKCEFGFPLHAKIMEPTLLGGSPWLLCWVYGNTLGWKNCKWMKDGSKTCWIVFKLKHKQTSKNAIICRNQNKNVCKARQVMQTVTCLPTRRLKMSYWVDLLSLREPVRIEWWQKHRTWGWNIFIYSKTQSL